MLRGKIIALYAYITKEENLTSIIWIYMLRNWKKKSKLAQNKEEGEWQRKSRNQWNQKK